jgi:deoxyribonuclease V
MYLCADVHYAPGETVAAAAAFQDFRSPLVEKEYIARTAAAAAYVPGDFYRRELPALLELLRMVEYELQAVVVDGYVWLSADGKPGLGAHLFQALAGRIPVIGVAKNPFRGAAAVEVLRGSSGRPLYVTAAGIDSGQAASLVRLMHGPHRVPTLLRHVDLLARSA